MLLMMYLVHCICPEFLLWVYFSMTDLIFFDTESIATQCEKKIEKACCRQVCVLCQIPNSGYFSRILDIRRHSPDLHPAQKCPFSTEKVPKTETYRIHTEKQMCQTLYRSFNDLLLNSQKLCPCIE